MCGEICSVLTLVEFLVMMTAVAVVSNCTIKKLQYNVACLKIIFKRWGV